MLPNRSSRGVHTAEFKAQIMAECRQPDASVSAVAIAHGLNTNVVRKWLAGRGLKRMGGAVPAASSGTAPALQFVPVELPQSGKRGLNTLLTVCYRQRSDVEHTSKQVERHAPRVTVAGVDGGCSLVNANTVPTWAAVICRQRHLLAATEAVA